MPTITANLVFVDCEATRPWATAHEHNPVHDALGNAEAFERIIAIADQFRAERFSRRP